MKNKEQNRCFTKILLRVCKVAIFLFIFFVGCGNNDRLNAIVEPQFATPESTIFKYWQYLNLRDYKNALRCFLSHNENFYDSSLIYPLSSGVESLSIDSIISKKMFGKSRCELYYRVTFYSHKDKCFKHFITGDRLKLTNKGWLIEDVLIH